MDWLTGIQNAINYIEEHLTEEIDALTSIFKEYSVFCVVFPLEITYETEDSHSPAMSLVLLTTK